MEDLISRQQAIESMASAIWLYPNELHKNLNVYENAEKLARYGLERVPSIEPTLYGYDLNHLAFIANVMRKEGITPEETIEIFRDVERTVKMVLDEVRESQERYIQSIMGGDQDATD